MVMRYFLELNGGKEYSRCASCFVADSPPIFFQTKHQKLEKFKFVLDYKIKELKRQIEPRENEISDMRNQIEEMDLELEQVSATIYIGTYYYRGLTLGTSWESKYWSYQLERVKGKPLKIRVYWVAKTLTIELLAYFPDCIIVIFTYFSYRTDVILQAKGALQVLLQLSSSRPYIQ